MDRIGDLLVFLIVALAVFAPVIDNPFFVIIAVPIILLLAFLFSYRKAVMRT